MAWRRVALAVLGAAVFLTVPLATLLRARIASHTTSRALRPGRAL